MVHEPQKNRLEEKLERLEEELEEIDDFEMQLFIIAEIEELRNQIDDIW